MSDTPTSSPRRNHYLEPSAGDDTAAVLDEALESLGTLRMPTRSLGDAGVAIHLLVSLMAEAERRLPRTAAEARDQDYSWAEIGDLLGTTRAAAWQRFAHRAQAIQKDIRRQLLDNPD